MIWKEPTDHVSDWYFCAFYVTFINKNNFKNIEYPTLKSATRPTFNSDDIPVSTFKKVNDISDEASFRVSVTDVVDDGIFDDLQPSNQKELNNLVHDLSLWKIYCNLD